MVATKGDAIRKNIIDDFTFKVRNYIETSTASSNERVFVSINGTSGRTVGQIIGAAAQANTNPGGPTSASLGTVDLSFLISNLRTWMITYARTHMVAFRNTGTGGSSQTIQRVVRLSTTSHGTAAGVAADFDTATSGFTPGTVLMADDINTLINNCQNIWRGRCKNGGAKHTYTVNYCHASHVSHSNHGSRGRR